MTTRQRPYHASRRAGNAPHGRMLATAATAGLVALLTLGATGCGVTGPESDPWSKPAEFGWQFKLGDSVAFMHWSNVQLDSVPKRTVFDVVVSDSLYAGTTMLELRQRGFRRSIHFALSGDTSIIYGVIPASNAALVGPLKNGTKWRASNLDAPQQWNAQIINLYAYRNVYGTVYPDVVEVEYSPENRDLLETQGKWLCYFSRGMGLVDAVSYLGYHPDNDQRKELAFSAEQRWALLPNATLQR